MKKNNKAVVIFAKPPIAGVAKTRLMPRLGAVGAAALHQKLFLRTLDNVHRPEQW
ncbi:MAG TPA: glycosyltransferase, partial [Gammaproteobacteria bacterium]|nr:glycosyltransferase [Gammaproteobacteria bacterium]